MTRSLVVMGPSGNGKSSLGKALADRLGWNFIEGDDHHPAANIAKMARGEPLTDTDRAPFLQSIGRALAASPDGGVAACSALKREYRNLLRQVAGEIVFVFPELGRDQLDLRMRQRNGHFMPASLLDSQLADLERPGPGETCLNIDGSLPSSAQADAVIAKLRLAQG